MITARDISLTLGGREILRSASLEMEPGDKVVIHGESGSGKTSLLRLLVGIHRPDTGVVEYDGLPLDARNAARIRSRLFYMPQEVRSIGDETVAEFVGMFFDIRSTRRQRPDKRRVSQELERFGLEPGAIDARMSSLSGGERQRVGLARGMLLGRDVMLLDEVTSAVDGQNRDLIVRRLLGLEGVTVVAVTHDAAFVEAAGRRLEVSAGRLLEA